MNRWVERIPLSWQNVLAWGGLRGAVSLALALSLPAALGPARDLLLVMAFGVVLFTLLAQATTMRPWVRWLGIVTRSQAQADFEASRARLATLRAADARLDRLHAEGLMSSPTWEKLKPIVTQRAAAQAAAVREVLQTEPALEAKALDTGWREVLRAQRAALLDLRRDGMLSEDVFEKLSAEVDGQLSEGYTGVSKDSAPGTQFIEVTLAPNSPAVGQTVVTLALPRTAVLVSIRRGAEIIIPRVDTHFQAGDVVTASCEREQAGAIRQILLAPTSTP